jgi:IS30 family transposase
MYNITKAKKYEYLNETERKKIEKGLKNRASINEIASSLYRSESTIRREIARGTITQSKQNPSYSKDPKVSDLIEYEVYHFDVGQKVFEKNRLNCVHNAKIESCQELLDFVENKVLKDKWSPDVAIGYAKKNNLFPGQSFTTKTFYNWVYKGYSKVKKHHLLRKNYIKQQKKSFKRDKNVKKEERRIDNRPSYISTREEFGHWEGDLIVGKEHKSYLFSLVERKSRIGFLFKVPNRESRHIVEIIIFLTKKYKKRFKRIFKSITFDNGQEFSNFVDIEKSGINIYYAHPYSSYERGSNENWNGIVRRFLPKGSRFEKLTVNRIKQIESCINNIPRKKLGYMTPMDLWKKELDDIKLEK